MTQNMGKGTCLLEVEVLVLVQLDVRGDGVEREVLLHKLDVQVGQVGCLPAPGENNWKHLNRKKMDQDMDVVRFMDHWTTRTIGTRARKDKTIRCGARFHQRAAATTRPAATYC